MHTLLFLLLLAQYSEAKPADGKLDLSTFQVEETFVNCVKNHDWKIAQLPNIAEERDAMDANGQIT